MKVLSVRQPWAYLIVEGYKDIENRKWRTSYRGPLLIHSSQAVDPNDFPKQRAWLNKCGVVIPEDLPRGAIVGSVNLVDVWNANCGKVRRHCSDCHQYDLKYVNDSPWFEGPHGFEMADAVPFYQPVPYRDRGSLGIREASDANLTGDLFESLEDALAFNEYLLTK
jgi:hypothetical protein